MTYRTLVLLFLLALSATRLPAQTDADLLHAIATVENHTWDSPGGLYALSYGAWSDLTDWPYSYANRPVVSTQKAHEHLAVIRRRLRKKGLAATPYMIAGCWRSGVEGFTERPTAQAKDYASRVCNLLATQK